MFGLAENMPGVVASMFTLMGIGPNHPARAIVGLKAIGKIQDEDGFGCLVIGEGK